MGLRDRRHRLLQHGHDGRHPPGPRRPGRPDQVPRGSASSARRASRTRRSRGSSASTATSAARRRPGTRSLGSSSDLVRRDAYQVPRQNILLGRRIRHGGWYPDYRQPQLFRRGRMNYAVEDDVHEGWILDGPPCAGWRNPIIQIPVFGTLAEAIGKMNRYTSLGVPKQERAGEVRELRSGAPPRQVGLLQVLLPPARVPGRRAGPRHSRPQVRELVLQAREAGRAPAPAPGRGIGRGRAPPRKKEARAFRRGPPI